MIVTCARCGHVAGAMCPHCGYTRGCPEYMGSIGEYRYCGITDDCLVDQLEDNIALEEGYGCGQVISLSPPMTPEEEEMLAEDADMGIGTED